MANGTLNFLAGIADGFTETMRFKQEQERREKMAKLTGQLAELKIKAAKDADELDDKIREILNPPAPAVGFEQPEVIEQKQAAQEAPLVDRLTEAAMASGDLSAIIQLQKLQQGQKEFAQEQDFNELVQGLITGGTGQPGGAGGVFGGTGGQPPTAPQTGATAPSLTGFRPPRLELGPSGGKVILQPVTEQDRLFRQRLKQERAEFQQSQQELSRQRAKIRSSLRGVLPRAKNLRKTTEILRGSFLETGQPFSSLRESLSAPAQAVSRLLGREVKAQEIQRARTALDIFQKESADLATRLMGTLTNLGRMTDQRAEVITAQITDPATTPDANLFIISKLLTEALQAIEDEGINVDKATIKEMRALRDELQTAVTKALQEPVPVGEMSTQELLQELQGGN